MKKHFVIANIPVRLPIQSTILYSFLLHYFKADNIWWGIFITIYSILWIIAIAVKWNEERVDLNADTTDTKKQRVISKFQQKMNEMILQNEKSKQ